MAQTLTQVYTTTIKDTHYLSSCLPSNIFVTVGWGVRSQKHRIII